MAYELISFPDDGALAQEAAAMWLKVLAQRRDKVTPYLVALSGGRIASKFFAAVVARSRVHLEWFINVHFFWADERCVPPDHADSNYHVALTELFEPLAIPASSIHRLRGEIDPQQSARKASHELAEAAGVDEPVMPQIDLVFLGMGEDAHVASLFPGEAEADRDKPDWFRPVIGPKPPPQRITMGYGLLAQAREVWVLASGKGKETALKESLDAGGKTPLGRVIASRAQTLIFTDIPQG